MTASQFSPMKTVEAILAKHRGENNAGKAACNLAEYYFFGKRTLLASTAGSLDVVKMRRIREIIMAKYGSRRCIQDQEVLWDRCKKAIGQKCNHLRIAANKQGQQS